MSKNTKRWLIGFLIVLCLALLLILVIKPGGKDSGTPGTPSTKDPSSAPDTTATTQVAPANTEESDITDTSSNDESSSETASLGAEAKADQAALENGDAEQAEESLPPGVVCENGVCFMPNGSD